MRDQNDFVTANRLHDDRSRLPPFYLRCRFAKPLYDIDRVISASTPMRPVVWIMDAYPPEMD
ncbi:hypothetical protein X946_4993 [Burkholderia sp. ABCPW 111]|nr:hypothetical protein X946_4993 [Burkholderia sp. ABCPW 111]